MDLDLSLSSLACALIFGVIGFYLLKEGRKRTNFAWSFIAIGLMAFPIFVSRPWLQWCIGFGLCGLAYYYR